MSAGLLGGVLSVALLFATAPHGATAGTPPPRLPIEAFAHLPAMSFPQLSPDGSHLLHLAPVDGRNRVFVRAIENGTVGPAKEVGLGTVPVAWATWVNNRRILVGIRFPGLRRNIPTVETRLLAVDLDGTDPLRLERRVPPGRAPVQIQDDIVDLLPEDDEHILVALPAKGFGYPDVYRMNVYTGRARRVQKSRHRIEQWITDLGGEVRLGTASLFREITVYARPVGSRKFVPVHTYEDGTDPAFLPMALAAGSNTLYVISDHAGDKRAVYEFDIARRTFGRRLFGREDVDITDVVIDRATRAVLGFGFTVDRRHIHYLDERYRAWQALLDRRFPDATNRIISSSRDRRLHVVVSARETRPGDYYLWDVGEDRFTLLGQRYPELPEAALAEMRPVAYEARDGLRIPAYLTLPPGIDARPLPTVIYPHGGPSSRIARRFYFIGQFLANRGYAVFQPNFRGSTGFGRAFKQAGHGQWGMAMQDDLVDGIRWLIARGIADPERICIVGGSYGGYAALMAAALTPELIKCAVSLNGVSDLAAWVADRAPFADAAELTITLGDKAAAPEALAAISPITYAERFTVPVLLAHGDQDRRVLVSQSRNMAAALAAAGRDHRLVILEGSDHRVTYGPARRLFLRELEAFLDRYLGPAASP